MRLNPYTSEKLWPFEFLESFLSSISSVSIYYWPESDIRVKSYGRLNFVVLPCLISSISIYYAPESDIRVKKYDHLTFSRASVVQFWATRYIIGLNWTSEWKVMVILICLVLSCLISSISIYCSPESDIRVKSYGRLNLACASMFNFEHHDILCSRIRHLSQKLSPFEFALCFHV